MSPDSTASTGEVLPEETRLEESKVLRGLASGKLVAAAICVVAFGHENSGCSCRQLNRRTHVDL